VGTHLREGGGIVIVRVDRIFALLIESGLIYCIVWVCLTSAGVIAEWFTILFQIMYCISTFGVVPSPSLTLIVFVSVSTACLHGFLIHILNTDLT
jgi:hypothetical protein